MIEPTELRDLELRLLADSVKIGLTLDAEKARKMGSLISLLLKWNSAYNLTAITDLDDVYAKHLLDSLSIASHIRGPKIVDVGTGAGFPGLPLAILYPENEFYLIDSNAKKIRFIRHVALTLDLKNVFADHVRIESWKPDCFFNTIVTRAFSDIATTLKLVDHLWRVDGQILFMKGPNFESELSTISSRFLTDTIPVHVPGLSAERFLLRVTQ